ncbi:hypothetical protein [Gracilibacillus sp. JCM 18860]
MKLDEEYTFLNHEVTSPYDDDPIIPEHKLELPFDLGFMSY